jgi:inorganic pyrophosphatase
VHDVDDLPPHVTEEIGQFFEVYKGLDEGVEQHRRGARGPGVGATGRRGGA